MAYSKVNIAALSQDPKVITAVEFLDDVHEKGHKEGELRKYLFNRKELSRAQIDEAFRIHHLRWKQRVEDIKTGNFVGRREEMVKHVTTNAVGERPEISTGDDYPQGLTFLQKERRVEGKRLILDFLKTEYNYVKVLECLKDDYHRDLSKLSEIGKVILTKTELNQIFNRIPELLNFHKAFFQNVSNQQNNIGQIFVRVFNHFRGYIEYTKDCTAMIITMRKHIHDKKLQRVLDEIREKSRRINDEMVDLLLAPLDRIMDYKQFLDKLLGWADQEQGAGYIFLGKASRRIGRIANYIHKHKDGIWNRNEMNKVQQFLRKQCNILTPTRRIIRRGLMIRRTTSWPVRKKHYIFFLFSDLLLWTSRKGELQNVVRLQDCEVMDSESKSNPKRKFKIVSTGQNRVRKVLLLECNLERQRDKWFNAVKQEIKNARQNCSQKCGMDEFMEFLALNNEGCMTPSSDNGGTFEEGKQVDANSTVIEKDDVPDSGPHLRYQTLETFPNSEFLEDFAPLDDAVSVTSEDAEPYSGMPKQEKYGDSMDKIFPIKVNRKGILDESKETPKVFCADNGRTASSRSLKNQEGNFTRNSPQYQRVQQSNRRTVQNSQDEGRLGKNGHGRFPQIHNSSIQSEIKGSSSTLSKMLEDYSSYTICLTEFL